VKRFYGELWADAGPMRYVNAGHNAPFVLHKSGEIERLHANSMALEPGARLLLFTDGVSEAFNGREQEYGEQRLAACLAKAREHDDMTLMVVAREG